MHRQVTRCTFLALLMLAGVAHAQESELGPLDLSLHLWDISDVGVVTSSLILSDLLDRSKERRLGLARLYFDRPEQQKPGNQVDFDGQWQAQAVIDFADEMFLLVTGAELPTMLQSNTFELIDTELPPILIFGTSREKMIQLKVPLN